MPSNDFRKKYKKFKKHDDSIRHDLERNKEENLR